MKSTTRSQSKRVLILSTASFTILFAVWMMFGVLGIPIQKEFGLSDQQLAWIPAVAILNGSIWRLFAGIWTDKFGGRAVMTAILVASAIPAYLVSTANSYSELLFYAFLAGFAGNSFSVGIAWNAAWFERSRQGFALGMFGAGNVGASVTKLLGPLIIGAVPAAGYFAGVIPGGWRFIPVSYAILLLLMAWLTWFGSPSPDKIPGKGRSLKEMIRPIRELRVWRFSLYYVVVFGAYVALASWLPKYYISVYSITLTKAALLTAVFIFPASLLRPFGGALSDRFGARKVMYSTFCATLISTGILMMPYGHIVIYGAGGVGSSGTKEILQWQVTVLPFTLLIFILGCAMGIGKAAVYKHIPEYFPNDVGAVGGLVGMFGALGGFFLVPLFAFMSGVTGAPQSTFGVLFLVTLIASIWMHLTVVQMLHRENPEKQHHFDHGYSPLDVIKER